MPAPDPLHAGVVAHWRPRSGGGGAGWGGSGWGGSGWRGVLLRGPSRAGKSTLALRLVVEHGWRLAADDRAIVWAADGRAFARAPAPLHGLIEARTIGVLPLAALPWVELALVIDCAVDPAELERIPEPSTAEVAGVQLPRLSLDAHACDAPAKLVLLLQRPVAAPRRDGRSL